jgi:hypothetical protein
MKPLPIELSSSMITYFRGWLQSCVVATKINNYNDISQSIYFCLKFNPRWYKEIKYIIENDYPEYLELVEKFSLLK